MNMKKILVFALSLVLVAGLSVAGTIAWLTDTTEEIENVFTVGNIDIELDETTDNFKMIPGEKIAKNPKVTVKKGSEASWVFVQITENATLDSYIEYSVHSDWKALDGFEGVYYIDQAATTTEAAEYSVLTDDEVTVKTDVTKTMMDKITAGTTDEPTLTFKAYAIQKDGFETAAAAWAEVSKTPTVTE